MKYAAVMVSFGLLLGACGRGEPTERQVRAIMDNSFKPLVDLGATVVDVRKSNSERLEAFGQKMYVYEYLAAVQLPEGLAWEGPGMIDPVGGIKKVRPVGQQTLFFVTPQTVLPKGTLGVRRGKITFHETERGWVNDNNLPDTAQEGYCPDDKQPSACYAKLGWDKVN